MLINKGTEGQNRFGKYPLKLKWKLNKTFPDPFVLNLLWAPNYGRLMNSMLENMCMYSTILMMYEEEVRAAGSELTWWFKMDLLML